MAHAQIARSRSNAFKHQHGRCYYCGFVMWQSNQELFSKQHGLTLAQSRHLQCTAEHLVARQDGGSNAQGNIVAACVTCNQRRHKRATPPTPERYLALVAQRVRVGKWFPFRPACG